MPESPIRLLFALAFVGLACRGQADGADTGRPPAILPSMMPAQPTNADASPPEVPFSRATPVLKATARASWPHDTAAYTQGLLLDGARLLESTGGEGRSEVREVDRHSGRVLSRRPLASMAFGEGIALAAGRLYQLTWKGGRGYSYDPRTLAPLDSFSYAGEGWGLTTVDSLLYMSDGTAAIRVIDPRGFRELRRIEVREGDRPVWMLNELELVGTELWANVYETDFIARIDPSTGQVLGWVDVSGLLTAVERKDVARRGGVVNGIAYDAARGIVLLTGKLWPRVFEVDIKSMTR